MLKILFRLIVCLALFGLDQVSAAEDDIYNPKNYVYDDEGNPLFVKVYLRNPKAERRNQNKKHFFSKENDMQILNLMMQEDLRGNFIAIPIKKKKNDDDEDESNWGCPYCHTINPSSRNSCSNKDCPLYRKGWRDW
jgi:hypothetical protein